LHTDYGYSILLNDNDTSDNVYGAVIVAKPLRPGSFHECILSIRWPPTLIRSQPASAVSPPIGCYHPRPPSPFIIITQLESGVILPSYGGWKAESSSEGVQPVPKVVYRSGCRDKRNCPRENVGHVTPQSGTFPLDHCDTNVHAKRHPLNKSSDDTTTLVL